MKRKPPHKRHVIWPKKKIRARTRAVTLAPKVTEDWTIVRDILYRAELPRNDPGAYCPGGIFERAAKEIAAALSRPERA